ncbi:MAG TPA: homogentisate 1,2-dioxygenase [Trebonia sp.]|jgi:homogentisate 1,2-dioxygenase
MPYYKSLGAVPPKRHTQHRSATGRLYYEELVGEDGFSSSSSLLYHRALPSAIVDSRPWPLSDFSLTPNHPLKPRHFRLPNLFTDQDWKRCDVVNSRRLIVGNSDVRICYAVAGEDSPLYRNAAGDECVYVESGSARVDTSFGSLAVGRGDYVILARGVTHQWRLDGAEPLRCYIIEAASHIGPPGRYLSPTGQFLESAPYCERDLRIPESPLLTDGTDVEVCVKHHAAGQDGVAGSVLTYASHPFDVVGWDGCAYPYAFNVSDFEPITGRVHQPPPAHQVFEGRNFVVCNFVPRKVDYHPLAIPVPYFHSNVDSDEVMFYCGGDYEARKGSGISQGSVSLHPGGTPHGPQPGAYEQGIGADFFEELAVMIDTFRPLALGEGGQASEDAGYAWSWSGRR